MKIGFYCIIYLYRLLRIILSNIKRYIIIFNNSQVSTIRLNTSQIIFKNSNVNNNKYQAHFNLIIHSFKLFIIQIKLIIIYFLLSKNFINPRFIK